jgi:hypothetical protein
MSDANAIRNLLDASKEIEEICSKAGSQSKFYPCDGMNHGVCFLSHNLRIFFVGSIGYKDCVSHYFQTSCKIAYSAVQPGNVPDLIEIVSRSYSLIVVLLICFYCVYLFR